QRAPTLLVLTQSQDCIRRFPDDRFPESSAYSLCRRIATKDHRLRAKTVCGAWPNTSARTLHPRELRLLSLLRVITKSRLKLPSRRARAPMSEASFVLRARQSTTIYIR